VEGESFVFVSKATVAHFVLFTLSARGRSQWEFTTDFPKSSKFDTISEGETRALGHRLPHSLVRLQPYEAAYADWVKGGAPIDPEPRPKRRTPAKRRQLSNAQSQ
jgi:hypothetical protein